MSGGERHLPLKFLAEHNENIIAVITPQLSEGNRRFEQVILTAIEYGIPVIPVKKNGLDQVLSQFEFDILISCGFPYIIDNHIIKLAQYSINVHPTLLPKYRGFRSGPYVLINGEKTTGVTVHFITEEMDKGDILLQKSFPISTFDTTRSVYRKCKDIESEVLYEAVQILKSGHIKTSPQNENEASCISKIRTPKDSEIDWKKPLKELFNEIRACDSVDYPAFFMVDGQKVCIKLWRPDKNSGEEDMI